MQLSHKLFLRKMKISISVLFCIISCSVSSPLDEKDGIEFVEPEYLDYLLKEKQYDEFNRLLQIDVPHLSRPRSENDTSDPRFSRHLQHGDILFTPLQKIQAREGFNFVKYPRYKWPGGVVPFVISSDYTPEEAQKIRDCIKECNAGFAGCVVVREYRSGDKNYVFIFPGSGCSSRLGCTGGQQPLSLSKNGCLYCVTVCHEILHALGFCHQQSRNDRDSYIVMNWNNIKEEWKGQFSKVNSGDYSSCGPYDCYSCMHYPPYHRDVCVGPGKNAFSGPSNCDPNVIGNVRQMSQMDKDKVINLYCKNTCKNY